MKGYGSHPVLVTIPSSRQRNKKAESVGNHKPSQIMTEGSYMYSSHQGCDICIENEHDVEKDAILSWADFKKQVIAAYLVVNFWLNQCWDNYFEGRPEHCLHEWLSSW